MKATKLFAFTATPVWGAHLEDACLEAVRISRDLGASLRFEFDGVILIAQYKEGVEIIDEVKRLVDVFNKEYKLANQRRGF